MQSWQVKKYVRHEIRLSLTWLFAMCHRESLAQMCCWYLIRSLVQCIVKFYPDDHLLTMLQTRMPCFPRGVLRNNLKNSRIMYLESWTIFLSSDGTQPNFRSVAPAPAGQLNLKNFGFSIKRHDFSPGSRNEGGHRIIVGFADESHFEAHHDTAH